MTTPGAVLDFWFGAEPSSLEEVVAFAKRLSSTLDDEIRERFGALVEAGFRGELDTWAQDAEGTLALVLVIDQFPRHIFRGTARQYEGDPKALTFALAAFERGWASELGPRYRTFLSMPISHAEDVALHERNIGIQDEISSSVPAFWVPSRGSGHLSRGSTWT